MGPGLIALAAGLVPLVVHGTGDPADPAVVAIVDSTGVTACSGTVIDPHFVLTAGHCIVPQIAHGARIVLGSTVDAPVASVPIAGSRRPRRRHHEPRRHGLRLRSRLHAR